MAIIYLHGFASSGTSTKVDMLREHFKAKGVKVFAPDLHPDPIEVVTQITSLVRKLVSEGERKILFVGTSMGGFYAWHASMLFDAPAVMINPAIKPHETTAQWVGRNKNMSTGEEFEWHPGYLFSLRMMRNYVEKEQKPSQLTVVLAMDDELLDNKETKEFFEGTTTKLVTHETGGHRFSDFDKVIPEIEERYNQIMPVMIDI